MNSSRLWAAVSALVLVALAIPATAAALPAPLAGFGTTGAGAGQLFGPDGVEVAPSGDVYVADTDNERISVFSPTGTFLYAFGLGVDTGAATFETCTTASTCQAGAGGTAAGDFISPKALAFDGSGRLYVADEDGQRISVFNTAGPSFVHAFGVGVDTGAATFEVCTTASGCQGGVLSTAAGGLAFPNDLAIDGSGGLYVADTNSHRISLFNTAGPSFTRAFGLGVDTGTATFETCTTGSTCQAGIGGTAAGDLKFPAGIALDGSGSLHVSEYQNQRVSTINTAGPSFVRAFGGGVDTGASTFETCTTGSTCQVGTSGAGAGEIVGGRGMAIDGAGSLNVVEEFHSRISTFDPAVPSFTRAFGFGVDTGAAVFELCTTASTCQAGVLGAGVGQLSGPVGASSDCRGAIWVADTGNGRVQRFGEPGTALPPCPAPPTPTPPASTPASSAPLPPVPARKKCKKKKKKRSAAAAKKCKKK